MTSFMLNSRINPGERDIFTLRSTSNPFNGKKNDKQDGKGYREKDKEMDTEEKIEKEEKEGELSAEDYYRLGIAYEHGQGAHMDLDKAKEYFEKCIEKGGTAGAYNNLGFICQHTEGDLSKAKEYYQKALEMGSLSGYNNLGYLYWKGA